ncbi:50S ribosome-binding GTPase [bacterium]|nr:50S ribosome-binding GTPase [bacterium]
MIAVSDVVNIYQEFGLRTAASDLQNKLALLTSVNARVSVAGGVNTGKTSLINALLGSSFPTPAIPTRSRIRIAYEAGAIKDADLKVFNSPWLREKKLEIIELTDQNFDREIKPDELLKHFALTDICIFILNAQAALSNTDYQQLKMLNMLKISTLILFAKTDRMSQAENLTVSDTVKEKLKGFDNIAFLDDAFGRHVKEYAEETRCFIEKTVKDRQNVKIVRDGIKEAMLRNALKQITDQIEKKKELLEASKSQAEKTAAEDIETLGCSSEKWLAIKSKIRENEADTKEKMHEKFAEWAAWTIRNLNHAVDNSNNVKQFLENTLPYDVETALTKDMESAKNFINSEASKASKAASESIKKDFKEQLVSIETESESSAIEIDPIRPINTDGMTDSRTMRNISKLGTAATVIATGLVFTLGVTGMVMGTSVLAGLVAEYIIDEKQEKAKDQAKNVIIPKCVRESHFDLEEKIYSCICDTYDSLINSVDEVQKNWTKASLSVIENKKQKILDSCSNQIAALCDMQTRIDALLK